MIKFNKTNVVGFEAAIRIMHNPRNSLEKSDSVKCYANANCPGICKDNASGICIGPKDLDLMTRICYSGLRRSKILQRITACVNITAPLYWWRGFDNYKVVKVEVDYSSMIFMVPKILDKEFTLDDFSTEHLMEQELDIIQNVIIKQLNRARKSYKAVKEDTLSDYDHSSKDYLWQIIQLLPNSYNVAHTIVINYEVLANIYKSHKNYDLDEWREFCKWIESLPYSELITRNDKPTQGPDFLLR